MAERVSRRALLRGGVGAAAGAAVLAGPFRGFVALANGAPRQALNWRDLRPVADMRDGQVRLWLPDGFQYRSFHDTEFTTVLDDGTMLPGRHDGMGAFPGRNGSIVLVRNHEINGPGTPFGDPAAAYDAQGRSGTTTVEVTLGGEVLGAFTSLNGTQMNCSGGVMPWGSWITCEETVNGPDVGPDFTNVSNIPLKQRHGFIFEVPADGQSDRQPILSAGRFAHEAAAFDPRNGHLYLTEDNFGFRSGLYRYRPPRNPMETGELEDGGQLQMLAIEGMPNADLAASQPANARYRVTWVDIDDPAPTFPHTPGQTAPTANNDALQHVGRQGFAQGAAGFSRLEGAVFERDVVYFCSTQGGGLAETGMSDTVQGWGNGWGRSGRTRRAVASSASSTSRPAPRRWTSRTT